MSETKRLLENGNIEYTITKEVPRYTGEARYDSDESDYIIDGFKENCKIWTTKQSREGFDCLDTEEDWEPKAGNLREDMTLFQLYLDTTYGAGKYEAYTIGAYIHSGVSFAFNKGEDTRDRWDSGVIGFIGIPVGKEDSYEAKYLTSAWSGVILYEVYDELEDDWIDQCTDVDYDECKKWMEETSAKYGIDWDKVTPRN